MNGNRKEGTDIYYVNFFSELIEKIGYDPQRALLEVVLVNGGQVYQYEDVPEDIWYRLRATHHPDAFYRRKICGCYHEINVSEKRKVQNANE